MRYEQPHPQQTHSQPPAVERQGFAYSNLNDLIQGGIPVGSWVSLFGNPGAYKSLHSLAFTIAGLENREKVVYLSTEQSFKQLILQAKQLGWDIQAAYDAHLSLKLLSTRDYGSYDLVWIDLDSLRYLAWKLNALVREDKASKGKKKYYWYYDPDLMTFAIILGLEAVGVIKRRESDISLEQVERIRLRDGVYKSKYAMVDVDTKTKARVIIDSISVLFTGRWSIAGRILTDMKVRLEAPNITYLMTSHVSRSAEEEMGAQVGHVVDGRIRLWVDLDRQLKQSLVTGWIAKMRLTDHDRRLHRVDLVDRDGVKHLVWTPL